MCAGIETKAHAEAVRVGAVGFHGPLCQGVNVEPLEVELGTAGFHFLDIEHVVDEPHQALAIVVGDEDETVRCRRQLSGSASGQKPKRAGNRGERRAQFVVHVKDEFVLQMVEALALADIDEEAELGQRFTQGNRFDDDFGGEFSAVPMQAIEFAFLGKRAGSRMAVGISESPEIFATQPFREQNVNRPADQFCTLIAEHMLQSAVGQQDFARTVEHHDADRADFERKLEIFLDRSFRRAARYRHGNAECRSLYGSVCINCVPRADPAVAMGKMC